MKRVTMVAAVALLAGSVLAQTNLVHVYDFWASVRNSNVGTRIDRVTGAPYDYMFSEMNAIRGFLAVQSSTNFVLGTGDDAWLYLHRVGDARRWLYRVKVCIEMASEFVPRSGTNNLPQVREAQGFLVAKGGELGSDMSGFFNPRRDLGVTELFATGLGRVNQNRHWNGRLTLDDLSGQMVGRMAYNFTNNAPYKALCQRPPQHIEDYQNAALSGWWMIRRNRAMESVNLYVAETNIVNRFPSPTFIRNFVPLHQLSSPD